jgi:hypothetical protein
MPCGTQDEPAYKQRQKKSNSTCGDHLSNVTDFAESLRTARDIKEHRHTNLKRAGSVDDDLLLLPTTPETNHI